MSKSINGKRVVLSEGVSDKENLLPESFASGNTYGKWAKRLGLKVQNGERREMSEEEIEERNRRWEARGIEFINADIDVTELSPEHQKTLVTILNSLNSDNLGEIMKGPEGVTGPEVEDLMMEGLIKFRNDRLMERFHEVIHQNIDEIYIPWGAAHLPDIEERLISSGYEKINEDSEKICCRRTFRQKNKRYPVHGGPQFCPPFF